MTLAHKGRPQDNRINGLLRTAEAAQVLGICEGTLYNWVAAGKVPVVKMGHIIRFRRQTLEHFISKHERRALA